MTRKDYELIATAINIAYVNTLDRLAEGDADALVRAIGVSETAQRIASALEMDNPAFKHDYFLQVSLADIVHE